MINDIRAAYRLISAIKVSGEAVDFMAMARQHLREAEKKAMAESGPSGRPAPTAGEEVNDGQTDPG